MIYFAALLGSVIALKYLSPILVYVILSLFLTILLTPLMRFFERRKLPVFLGYLLSLSIFVFIFGVMFGVVHFSAREFVQNVGAYKAQFGALLAQADAVLSKYGYRLELESLLDFDIIGLVKGVVAKAGSILKGFLVVFIGVSFLLFEQRYFYKKLSLLAPNADLAGFFASTQKYFLIKTFTSFLTGLFVGLMLFFFDVPYWAVLGIMAFLFNFIPVIGSIIAAIPGILLALITHDLWTAVYVAVLYVVINVSISNILEPKLMGEGLDLSPAVVFFSLILWGWVFGAVGMFLAVPLTMTLKMALESDERTKRWAMLLSNLK
jgi:predicted PurR-regulated permease PerM